MYASRCATLYQVSMSIVTAANAVAMAAIIHAQPPRATAISSSSSSILFTSYLHASSPSALPSVSWRRSSRLLFTHSRCRAFWRPGSTHWPQHFGAFAILCNEINEVCSPDGCAPRRQVTQSSPRSASLQKSSPQPPQGALKATSDFRGELVREVSFWMLKSEKCFYVQSSNVFSVLKREISPLQDMTST